MCLLWLLMVLVSVARAIRSTGKEDVQSSGQNNGKEQNVKEKQKKVDSSDGQLLSAEATLSN